MGFCGFSIPAILMLAAYGLDGERWELVNPNSHPVFITFTLSTLSSACYSCISVLFVE